MQDNNGAKTIQLTQEGLNELKEELRELTEEKLPAVVDRVAKAREYGDLSENSEYHSAKEDQTLIETRIDEIQAVIANAQVVKNTTSHNKIGMGSTVVYSVNGKAKKQTITIVGEYEADPTEGKISQASPLGQALMGKKKGEKATVTAPAGEIEYEILEIK